MKRLKKMMALALAMVMVLAMSMTVFATEGGTTPSEGGNTGSTTDTVSITVHRDTETYEGEAAADSRNFTWYRVFTATYGSDFTGNSQNDGGYDTDGSPLAPAGDTTHPVAYVATAEVAAKMGSWVAAVGTPGQDGYVAAHWDAGTTGNQWFTLTPIAGSNPAKYNVSWSNANSDADTVQAAAKWIVEKAAYETSGTLDFTGSGATAAWSKDGLEKGYYVLSSEAGDNLIAATTDVEVKEKNDYPPLDKEQKDHDDGEDFGDEDVKVAVGDQIDYSVTVTIPLTAKVGDQILVWDKATEGLTYNNDVAVTNTANATVADYTGTEGVEGASWQKLITVTAGSQGKEVVFNFSMTVNSSALVDVDKKNTSGLKYGRGSGDKPFPYESTPDEVEYKTYFGGIEKVDGQNASTKLEGVKFALTENGTAFNVTKSGDYYIPGGSSNEVVTAADGTIKIRGLDDDKTYVLTETENPNEGYNMLAEPVTLTLSEDTASKTTYTPVAADAEFDSSATYYVKSGETYTAQTDFDADAFAAADKATLFIGTTTGTSSYDGTTADTWQDVINNKGTILPSTGGIGTTIFYIIGAILVIGAGVLLVTRRRMNAN